MTENNSSVQSLEEIIKNKSFCIPLYQRNYKWNADIAQKLAEDLLNAYKNRSVKSIGLITLYKNKEGGYDVIDGQQRLITLAILFSLLSENEPILNPIELCFGRDNEKKFRKNTLYCTNNTLINTTDTDRIIRNRTAMEEVVKAYMEKNSSLDNHEFKKFILSNCQMLCSVMENPPVEEFMNLNAYKTAFSVCDYVRSNLIMLNTFNKKELEENISVILGGLSRYTYKTAIAELYNQILDILYTEDTEKGAFSSPYKVLIDTKRCSQILDADSSNESRINVLFENCKEKNYRYEPENKDFNGWKQELIRLSWIYRLLNRLKYDMENGDFSSAKAIDNYEKINKNSFVSLLLNLKDTDKNLSLSELLNKYSNVNTILVKDIDSNNLKLANRYFEAFASAHENKATNNVAEIYSGYSSTPCMKENEIIASISSAGRYVLDRFLIEQHYETDSTSIIPPILDLEDIENNNLGGEFNVNTNDTITVGKLFENTIKIPVIQRDYCMGAQFGKEKDNFLTYLITEFEKFKNNPNEDNPLNISTILVSKEIDCDAVYIFDGQQRTFTLYQILKFLEGFNDEYKYRGFEFIGREQRECGSSYSKVAVQNLHEQLEEEVKNFTKEMRIEFKDFLLNNVIFTVKKIGNVSSAEQFFMDINGGVALKPYEIYKSCLYDRLVKIGEKFTIDFMNKLENDWLKAIYNLLGIKESDDRDEEEITEIRLIEYLCRYFYKKKFLKTADAFDAISSISMVVEKTRAYLEELELDDFEKIISCMNRFMKNLNANSSYIANIKEKQYSTSSNCDNAYIRVVELNQPSDESDKSIVSSFVSSNEFNKSIITSFVSSFCTEKREELLFFYSCKESSESWKEHKWLIENIYDSDEFADYIIQSTLTNQQPSIIPYENSNTVVEAVFVGGYQVGNIGKYDICETEIPAYYADMPDTIRYSTTIRPYYLYKQVDKEEEPINLQKNSPKKIAFFLTDGEKTINHPNNKSTMFSLSKYEELEVEIDDIYDLNGYTIGKINAKDNNKEQSFYLTHRTDAYCLRNHYTKSFLGHLKNTV